MQHINVVIENPLFLLTFNAGKEAAKARAEFENPWNRLHAAQTVASVFATVLVFAACVA